MTNHEFFLQMCAAEHPRFIGVVKAAPGDRLEYRPHERSRSAYELIAHLIGHEQDLLELLETGTINHRMQVPFDGIDDAARLYAEAHEQSKAKLAAMDEGTWDSLGQFFVQGNLVMEATVRDLAWLMLMDAIHHRGQLSTYLRPMGGKVPGIYGPSADTMIAKA